ncbi:MAG: UDP-N-acetylmuramate dehydrogenase [Candidatus Levybacteria bacterium]|nr:UDP-N-acetylmuramate dehydrogenase [Candidatus Levybacteria bacterium]
MPTLQTNISLSDFSNFKIGGNARYFIEVFSIQDLIEGLKKWHEISKGFPKEQKRIFVLGGGTNILFSDDGFDGLVIKDSIDQISLQDDLVTVGAGTSMESLLNFCIENSLSGLEWAGGLPGTVGGSVRGNAGAYNGETKDTVFEVESINLDTLETIKRNKNECKFNYRTSIFKKSAVNEIITYIKFKLIRESKEDIKNLIEDKINKRKLRHPLEYPNVGSIFKNVPIEKFPKEILNELKQYIKDDPFPVIPTAKLTFLAGLCAKRIGDAQVSQKHTNFIVNLGSAKAKDVKKLIKIIQNVVKQKFNVNLELEVMFVD